MADSNTVTTVPVLNNVTGNLNATLPTTVQVAKMINWLTFAIGLPAIGLAIYILKNLSKGEKKMPMHVVFLLISDVVSFFSRPHAGQQTGSEGITSSNPTDFIFYFGVISNISLMLFIAQEHHVLVAYPQCVGCCGNIRRSAVVALIAWAAPFAVLALAVLQYNLWFAVAMLTPFPFLLFFAVDSWRALICSRSNPSTPERRRTVWGLAAMWANYTFLYSPFIISVLLEALSFQETTQYLGLVSHLLLFLGPLVDPFLYVLMTKGFREVLHALPCCKKAPQTQDIRPTVDTVAETVETRL